MSLWDWWSRVCDWLSAPPRSKRIEPGVMVFLGWKELPVGNKLRGTLAFASLPSGYEGEIVARAIEVIVNGASRGAETLEVGWPNFEFDVVQGDAVRIEYRYVDDAGNRSESAQVLDFVASDVTPPPSPTDGTLSFVEVLDAGQSEQPLDQPADPVSEPVAESPQETPSAADASGGASFDASLGAPLDEAVTPEGDSLGEAAL